MSIDTAKAKAILRQPDRFMMLTHQSDGDHFNLDNGARLPKAVARELQSDLFVRPSEDGLFPGFSQTFTVDA
jgi:hypothetical protein